ncbi:MAG: diaminobutyrate--2-oxoglutarate transaminase [Pseudomonadota bacterium]
MDAQIFETMEAQVRSYCRSFPTVFAHARGATLTDADGRAYIDFLAGAGTLNYGHNNPRIRDAVIAYLQGDGVAHALDMYTVAKATFLTTLRDTILEPRGLGYKVTFPAPTGTNAVETAMKYARRATGRSSIIAFTNAFHGMTLGSLAASGNRAKRDGAGVAFSGITRLPYDGYMPGLDSAALLKTLLEDGGSGVDKPAAIIVETVQAEGGLQTASPAFMRALAQIAAEHGILLIVDDIQTGCGRTGPFFSFEEMGVVPDIVCLSKAIGGMGLPLALVLFKPELDVLKPGEHNGTFRGNNLAFVAATQALSFWREPAFVMRNGDVATRLRDHLERLATRYQAQGCHLRGRGLLLGLSWDDTATASAVSRAAFARGLIMETTGAKDQVLKLLPPLTITDDELARGLDALDAALEDVCGRGDVAVPLQAAE